MGSAGSGAGAGVRALLRSATSNACDSGESVPERKDGQAHSETYYQDYQ